MADCPRIRKLARTMTRIGGSGNEPTNPTSGLSIPKSLPDGARTGRGVYVWANGSRYEGDWKDGKRMGRGVYVTADGDRYEGEQGNDLPC
jgi:hypothetical protein